VAWSAGNELTTNPRWLLITSSTKNPQKKETSLFFGMQVQAEVESSRKPTSDFTKHKVVTSGVGTKTISRLENLMWQERG
jgi:hypothetical protein